MSNACAGCGEYSYLMPLHGERGGPLRCPLCIGQWNAKHTKRLKWGRTVIKSMKLFLQNGGKADDINKLKTKAILGNAGIEFPDLLSSYDDTFGDVVGDLTAELLADVLQLVHPDRHPPERQETAKRVTQELLALRPFVFSAPKPTSKPAVVTQPRDDTLNFRARTFEKPSRDAFPCELCSDQVPLFYCDPCKTEWDARNKADRDKDNAKQRRQYARRRDRKHLCQEPVTCAVCGNTIKSRRKGVKFCGNACRQKAHRRRVTPFQIAGDRILKNRNEPPKQVRQ